MGHNAFVTETEGRVSALKFLISCPLVLLVKAGRGEGQSLLHEQGKAKGRRKAISALTAVGLNCD
jgi:hypothetical protein